MPVLPIYGPAEQPPRPWLRSTQRRTRKVDPLSCDVDLREYNTTVEQLGTGAIHRARDKVGLHETGQWVWECEKAKIAQWQHRTAMDAATLANKGIVQEAALLTAQETGFRMPSWNTLEMLREAEGLTTTVGPSVFEAPPTFAWSTAEENYEWGDNETPLILLGAIPRQYHDAIVTRLEQMARGAVIVRKEDINQETEDRLK